MKRGLKIYADVIHLDAVEMLKHMRTLKGHELARLVKFTGSFTQTPQLELVLGTAMLVASERYFDKALKKQTKKAKAIL